MGLWGWWHLAVLVQVCYVQEQLAYILPGFAGVFKEEYLRIPRLWLRLTGFSAVHQSQEGCCGYSQDVFIWSTFLPAKYCTFLSEPLIYKLKVSYKISGSGLGWRFKVPGCQQIGCSTATWILPHVDSTSNGCMFLCVKCTGLIISNYRKLRWKALDSRWSLDQLGIPWIISQILALWKQ